MITGISSTKCNKTKLRCIQKELYTIYFKKVRKSEMQIHTEIAQGDKETKHTLSSQLMQKNGKIRQVLQTKVLVKLGKGNNQNIIKVI